MRDERQTGAGEARMRGEPEMHIYGEYGWVQRGWTILRRTPFISVQFRSALPAVSAVEQCAVMPPERRKSEARAEGYYVKNRIGFRIFQLFENQAHAVQYPE